MSISKQRIKEIVLEEVNSQKILEESIWSKMKNFAAKIGSLEKGGKIRGRKKRSEAAQRQYMQAMEKLQKYASKESKTLIDRLENDFKKAGYPNQEDKFEFLEQTLEMGAFYESLKKAVEQKEMEVVVANEVIQQLRLIVKKFLDYELADIYKHFAEDVDRDRDDHILESIIAEFRAESLSEQQDEEEGPIGTDKDSTTIKGLKANTLPAVLAAIGAGSLLGKFLIESDWFKEITTKVLRREVSVEDFKESVVGTLSPEQGEGVTQMLGRVLHGDAGHFSPDLNPQAMFQEMSAAGINPSDLSQLSSDPTAFMDAWQTATSSGAGTLEAMFGAEPGALGLVLGKKVILKALIPVLRSGLETVAKTTVVGKAGAILAPYLAPLGISLVAAAAGVKALRMKGLKSSRAQVLNDLLQSLDYLDRAGDKEPIIDDEDPIQDPPPIQPPPGVPEFRVPVLIRFDDDDVKYYKLNARYLKKQGNREQAEKALNAIERNAVMGRDLQESEAFLTLFEQDDNDLEDTESFEREFGRGDRAKDLKSAIRRTGRRRKLKSGARTKPVFYYAFDQSIQNDLEAMGRGAKFNHFVSRILRKAIAAVKAKGNKALTPEEAFYAIKRKGGGGTGMKGLSIKEAIELLRKYKVVQGDFAKADPEKSKAPRKGVNTALPPRKGGEDSGSRGGSAGSKARKRQRARSSQKSSPRVFGGVTETFTTSSIGDEIRECRSLASDNKFQKLINGLFG